MRYSPHDAVDRRKFLEKSFGAGALAGVLLSAQPTRAADGAAEPLTIEGYCDQMSYAPGEQLGLHISTTAEQYSIEIARVGMERKVVWTKSDLPGKKHPTPADAAMRGCNWPVAQTLNIPRDWRSGYYSVIVRGTRGGAETPPKELFFVLRSAEPGRDAKILFQLSTNTYQAYNNWGGSCLYSGPKFPRVSFNRPFDIFQSVLQPGKDWYNPNNFCCHTWDLPFIAWAERNGYAIDYAANLDLELHPEILDQYKLVLSVGHDEYWSIGMRDNLEAFIGRGGNVAFFSGNSVCWQVRTEENGRALVAYKAALDQDPVFATDDHHKLSTLWSNALLKRPENQLTGVGFAYGGYNGLFGEFMTGPDAGSYTVHRPGHWLLEGTGLKAGDKFGGEAGIAGYECDGCEFTIVDGLPVPTGRDGTPKNFEIVATAHARWSMRDKSATWATELRKALQPADAAPPGYLEQDGSAVLGVYTRGGTVVTVGSCDWSDGLKAADPVVERIFRNVLDRLSA